MINCMDEILIFFIMIRRSIPIFCDFNKVTKSYFIFQRFLSFPYHQLAVDLRTEDYFK